MASHLFLISYILDDQPMTCELHSEADTLSREEARRHLRHCIDRTTPRRSAISRSARWSVPMNRAPRRDTTSSPDGGRGKRREGSAGAGLEFRLELVAPREIHRPVAR